MKKLPIIISVFIILNAKAQEFVKETTKYERFKFEAGILIPLGNLKSKIDISQQFGFWYRTRIEHKRFVRFRF